MQACLWPLLVQTQGAQHLQLFIWIYYIFHKSSSANKTMSIIEIVTLDITQLNVLKVTNISKDTYQKTAGAVTLQTGSAITEKEQLLCNTP